MVSSAKEKSSRRLFCRVPLKVITVSVLSLFASRGMFAADVDIGQTPLAGVQSAYQPNIVLVPSVEYPTAGGAYSSDEFANPDLWKEIKGYLLLDPTKGHFRRAYKGYFDPAKCYTFVPDYNNGYFYATSMAQMPDYGCPGQNEFSGSVLNWGTMSALDMFRKTLTGGNRVYGTGVNASDYREGDGAKTGHVYLRRAMFNEGWNTRAISFGHEDTAAYRTRMRFRGIRASKMSRSDLARYVPQRVVDAMMNGRVQDFRYINENGTIGGKVFSGRFADENLYFHNYNYGFIFARAVRGPNNELFYVVKDRGNNDLTNRYLPVVVRVCDSNIGEDAKFCVSYGNKRKPEGLIQSNARKGARFAAFGFLYTRKDDVDGGVLRAPMKYLTIPTGMSSIPNNQEWNPNTGELELNPDRAKEGNSGVINYINKFGDIKGYKDTDPSGELYYAAMRYLRGMSAVYVPNPNRISNDAKDGFPVYSNWRDPLTDGFPNGSKEPMCRPNTIIWIGDTNTHYDNNLPNWHVKYKPGSPWGGDIRDDRLVDTQTKFEQIWKWEGSPGGVWYLNRSLKEYQYKWTDDKLGHSPGGVAGIAYWARINDTRPDIPNNQFQSNFIIDVLEGGHSKETAGNQSCRNANDNCNYGNPWYWAAKYGGFDHGGNLTQGPSFTNPNDRPASWKANTSTAEEQHLFPKGMPKNFALGNSPENMETALNKAFALTEKLARPSQAAPTFTTVPGQAVDLSNGRYADILSTTYDFAELTGDVLSDKYRLHPRTGIIERGAANWSAARQLDAAFHNSGYASRKVYVRNKSNGFVQFNTANKGQFASTVTGAGTLSDNDVINYVLGDNSRENAGTARVRTSILGTLVNPTVAAVTAVPPENRPAGCTYPSDPAGRRNNYVVSANDGMVHILNENGQEKMALMLSTALPYLSSYATPGYVHRYLNDGVPVVTETCMSDGKAHSVVVGTAGRGGAAVYAIDATDLSSPGANNLLWEFTSADDQDFGVAISTPVIAKDKNGKPIAIVSSGYKNTSNVGSIFILNVDKARGASWSGNYQKITLGSRGVGPVAVYDANNDGIPERLYAGDYDGNLWRVEYNQANNTWTPSKLFEGSAPITTKPDVQLIGGKIYVIVGTGQYLSQNALDSNQQNYVYGFIDEGTTSIKNHAELLQQKVGEQVSATNKQLTTINGQNAKAYAVSQNEFKEGQHKGWYMALPRGQIVTADAEIYGGRIAYFQSVSRTDDPNSCSLTGSTSFIGLNLKDGAMPKDKLYDTNGDGKFDNDDVDAGIITVANNLAVVSSSVMILNSVGSQANLKMAVGTNGVVALQRQKYAVPPPPTPTPPSGKAVLRRISWREIF